MILKERNANVKKEKPWIITCLIYRCLFVPVKHHLFLCVYYYWTAVRVWLIYYELVDWEQVFHALLLVNTYWVQFTGPVFFGFFSSEFNSHLKFNSTLTFSQMWQKNALLKSNWIHWTVTQLWRLSNVVKQVTCFVVLMCVAPPHSLPSSLPSSFHSLYVEPSCTPPQITIDRGQPCGCSFFEVSHGLQVGSFRLQVPSTWTHLTLVSIRVFLFSSCC